MRPEREYAIGHFETAVSIPLSGLDDHRHMLPRGESPFWVFGDDDEVARALEGLRDRGFRFATPHPAMAPGAAPSAPVPSAWVAGPERVRLWRPSPFLEATLADSRGAGGRALDLACGSGRELAFLALAGFAATGVDLLPDALDRARVLWHAASAAASANGAPPLAEPLFLRADLESAWPLAGERFDLVTCFRFLWRLRLDDFAAAIAPGGSIVYETFTVEQARHGKPRQPEHLLQPGELRAWAESRGLRVMRYREDDPPGGPSLASLWARAE